MSWKPELYLKFADERTRPVMDLLARIPRQTPSTVIDIGCGPGNSTAVLRARWPEAEVIGIDSSAEMIAAARERVPSARFEVADFESWTLPHAPDVIFSNAALHWADDPVGLAARLVERLAPAGVLAFQIPQNFDRPSHTIAKALADAFGVPEACAYDPARFPVATDFARALSTTVLDIWTTKYLHRLQGDDPVYAWIESTTLRPILARLDADARAAFANEAKRRLREAYPRERDGVTTLFPFRRLFVVAAHR